VAMVVVGVPVIVSVSGGRHRNLVSLCLYCAEATWAGPSGWT
jgi:hypothetical protein